jgi:hypothetical protein
MLIRYLAEAAVLKHRGSNNLTIDGERFRYVVSEAGSDADGRVALSLFVQHAETNGSRLQVTGLFAERVPEMESKYYMGRTLKRPVSPKDAEQLVRTALSHGWRPRESGKPFVLKVDIRSVAEESG